MTVDLGAAIAVGSLIFAAGGVYYSVKRTSASAANQGKRIGRLEIKVAALEGMLRVRRKTVPQGTPVALDDDES